VKVRRLFTLLALAGSLAPGAVAQDRDATVIGRVVSARDSQAIQAALVRVLGTHLQDNTHQDGGFVLTHVPVGAQRVLVSAIGYKARMVQLELTPGDTSRVAVALEESVLQLEEIVATGTSDPRPLSETLSPTSVVSGASLDRQLDGTLAATLRHEPGVASGAISGATAQPVIRGLGGDRVVVLQDGLRPGDLASTSADHAVTIDPLTARSIEVVRGPMSLLYGSSALGGVVNVRRDEIPAYRPEEPHGVATAQASSVNRGGAVGGYVTAGTGALALRGEATARGTGDTRTPVGRLVNTQASTIDLAGSASYVGHGGHAGVSYRFYDHDYGIPGGFVGGHEQGVDIAMQRHTVRGAAELHPGAGRWDAVAANVGATFYRHTETGGTLRTPSTADYAMALFAVQEYVAGAFRLQAGLRYDFARYEPSESGTINVGGEQVPIRARTFGSFSGSAGALVGLARGVQLGASVARAYRTPDFIELYSDGPHLADNSYTVGDPSLAAESGLGFDLFTRFERSRVRAEVAAFRNTLSDYVFPSSRGRAIIGPQGGRPLFQYSNEAARFSGVEASVAVSLAPRLLLEGTGSYVAAKFTRERAPVPIIEPPDTTFVDASAYPPFIPPFFGTLELRYERPSWFVGGGARWAAAQDRLGDFETKTDGYAIGDLHAGLRLLLGGQFHTITLRVDNLTNAEYRDHLSRIKAIMPQPGRNVSLLYRVAF